MILPDPSQAHTSGWYILSRRARRFQSEAQFASYAVARMLPCEALHARIADKVWMAFMRGEFDVAVFQAMKAVEVAVRDAGELPDNLLGVKLMREAFRDNGPLADMSTEAGERVGRMELFAGAIGSYKVARIVARRLRRRYRRDASRRDRNRNPGGLFQRFDRGTS